MNNRTIRSLCATLVASALALNGCYGAPPDDDAESAPQGALGGPPIDIDPCVFQAARPDLVIDSFAVQNVNGYARLRAVLRNRGCADAPYMPYAIVVTLPGASTYGATWAPTSTYALEPYVVIPRGQVLTFELDTGWTYTALKAQGGTWRVEADGFNHVVELSESNNVSTFAN